MFPSKDKLTICFAHVAYQLQQRFLSLDTGIGSFEVRDGAALERRIGEADVLVVSGLWRNDLLPRANRLRFIQSIGAGTDQFPREALAAARRAPGERPRRECPRGRRARHGVDPRARPPAAGGARQPGQARVARHDRRSRRGARTSSAARR